MNTKTLNNGSDIARHLSAPRDQSSRPKANLEAIKMVVKDRTRVYQWQVGRHWALESFMVQESREARQRLKEATLTRSQSCRAVMSMRGSRDFETNVGKIQVRSFSVPTGSSIKQKHLNYCQSVNKSVPDFGQARTHRWELSTRVKLVEKNKMRDSYLKLMVLALCCCSVARSCPTLWDLRDYSTSGFPTFHHLPELAQIHVHQEGDANQSSHPLLSPSPPAFNLPQHQSLL